MNYLVHRLSMKDAAKILASIKLKYGARSDVTIGGVQDRIKQVRKMNGCEWIVVEDNVGRCVCIASVFERDTMCYSVVPSLFLRTKLPMAMAKAVDEFVCDKIAPSNKVMGAPPFVGYVAIGELANYHF